MEEQVIQQLEEKIKEVSEFSAAIDSPKAKTVASMLYSILAGLNDPQGLSELAQLHYLQNVRSVRRLKEVLARENLKQ